MKALVILSILFLGIAAGAVSQKKLLYRYADGSGNQYIITPLQIEYKPVPIEMSSTGQYSGGLADTVAIQKNDFETIGALFGRAADEKSQHIDSRIKTSGAVAIINGDKITEFILSPEAPNKKEIEALLKKYIGNNRK